MKIANKTTLPNLISAPLAAAFLLTLGVTVSFSTLAADVPPPEDDAEVLGRPGEEHLRITVSSSSFLYRR